MESTCATLACRQLGDHSIRNILPAKVSPLMKYCEAHETSEAKQFDQSSFEAGTDELSKEWDEFLQEYPECERFLDTDAILNIQNGGSFVDRENIVFPSNTYRVDLNGFTVDDVVVRTHGTKLNVIASHEQRNDDGSVYKKTDLVKEFRLPDNVDKGKLHSELQDGMHLLVHNGMDM